MREIARWLLTPLARLLLGLQPHADRLGSERIVARLGSRGANVTVRRNVVIQHPSRLRVGSNVLINHNCVINAGGGIEIGSNVVIGPGCFLLTTNHEEPVFFGHIHHAPIKLGSNLWLAANVTVVPGVEIGDNVIVAAGAVVTRDVASGWVVAGVPATEVRRVRLGEDSRAG